MRIRFPKNSTVLTTKEGYNNTIKIMEDKAGTRFVIKELGNLPVISTEALTLTPYLDQSKLRKEVTLCNTLYPQGIPTPLGEYEPNEQRAILSFSAGSEVTATSLMEFTSAERRQISYNLGRLIAQITQAELPQEVLISLNKGQFSDTRQKHSFRLARSLAMLEHLQVLSSAQRTHLLKLTDRLFPQVPVLPCELIHGDIYFGNVFVDSTTKTITGLIDWADSSELDDTLTELILTARWFAFDEFYTDWNKPLNHEYFTATIVGFNDSNTQQFDKDFCKTLLLFYEILWHCKVLLAEAHKEKKDTVEHFSRVLWKAVEILE